MKTRFNIWKKEKGENKIREQKFPDEHLLRRKTWYIGWIKKRFLITPQGHEPELRYSKLFRRLSTCIHHNSDERKENGFGKYGWVDCSDTRYREKKSFSIRAFSNCCHLTLNFGLSALHRSHFDYAYYHSWLNFWAFSLLTLEVLHSLKKDNKNVRYFHLKLVEFSFTRRGSFAGIVWMTFGLKW